VEEFPKLIFFKNILFYFKLSFPILKVMLKMTELRPPVQLKITNILPFFKVKLRQSKQILFSLAIDDVSASAIMRSTICFRSASEWLLPSTWGSLFKTHYSWM